MTIASTDLAAAFQRIRENWGWFFALGFVLVLFGGAALAYPWTTAQISMMVVGWVLVFSGTVQALFALRMRGWGGVALNLLAGILEIVVGMLLVKTPAEAVIAFTLLISVYLLVGGIYRIAAALALRIPGAGWLALSGFISAVLGIGLVFDWPHSATWLIGTYVGIDLVFHGISWIVLALGVRRARA